MFRTTLFTTFVAALFLVSPRCHGQITFSVIYDSLNFIQPTTVNFGGMVSYTIGVRNNSTTVSYSGPIAFMRRVGTGPADTIFSIPGDTILPLDTNIYVLQDSITTQRFGGGINGVVIWPTAPNTTSLDTAFGYLEVIPVGRPDPRPDGHTLQVYPNPSAGTLQFQPRFSSLLVDRTLLMDGQGQVLMESSGLPEEMDLRGVAAGLYFLEVRMRDGFVHRFKVIRRD